ncbi:hypothetical protein [Archangium sp.]|jgi:hypothetical protein|uniref:hypothetical protein n=1 Tax=Archangium sp. TaxID=1872627 RepID=UPI002ED8DCE7
MSSRKPPSLQLPSFLHGLYPTVQRKAREEGLRCGHQYREAGTFPAPQQLLEVQPGEVVVTQNVVDFQHERPSWRLYMVSDVMNGLWEALDWPNTYEVDERYEAFCRETAWGALYFAIAQGAPMSAERTAQRLQAVLRFWEPLQSVRYLFRTLEASLTLEELMEASCAWAMDAWCPEGEGSVLARLERAVERMARATREDSLEAIFREMPRALAYARDLKHRKVLADPTFQRERFATLDPRAFDRVSSACTSGLLEKLYDWDHELGKH